MKIIHLIRHAESNQNNSVLSDFSRVLNENGQIEVSIMSKKLLELGTSPEYFISSPANRTKETSRLIAKKLNFGLKNIIIEKRIYESSLTELLQILYNIPNNYNNIFMVGHNPSITKLSNYLTYDTLDFIPTCGIVKIEFDIDNWHHIIQGIGRKLFFVYPKMF